MWALLVLLAFIVAFPPVYAALVPEQRGSGRVALPEAPAGSYRVFVADWGYHTSIIVQQPAGWALGPPGRERAAYLDYAWGDRRFYMESDYRPASLFATLVLPTATVVYLDGRAEPELAEARVAVGRTVDAATLTRLVGELEGSFARTADGRRPDPFPPVEGYAGRFYPARGAYLWARDCNWWTVRRLAAAGLARGAAGVVFSGQVPARLVGFTPEG
jgi:hypothetical protein